MEWAKAFEEKPKQVFVCHGEDTSCQVLTEDWKMNFIIRRWHRTAELFTI